MLEVLPSDEIVQSTRSDPQPSPTISPPNSDVEKQILENGDEPIVNASKTSAFRSLGWLDRFLALWIFLAMAIGIILGNFVPNTGPSLQKGKFVGVSIPIAVGLLVMMYPILCKVKFETLHRVFRNRYIWIQILFSIFVNWIIAPLVMVCSPSHPPLKISSDFHIARSSMGVPPRQRRPSRGSYSRWLSKVHRNGKPLFLLPRPKA